MDLPLGYVQHRGCSTSNGKLFCKLHKSVFGLKQASRQWYSKFSHSFVNFGFTQSKSDYSLFTKGSNSSFIALLVYVDDIVITGPSQEVITDLKIFLHSQFKLHDWEIWNTWLELPKELFFLNDTMHDNVLTTRAS